MIKSITIKSLLIIIILINFISCTTEKEKRNINFPKTDLAAANFIPKPLEVTSTQGGFALDELTAIRTSNDVSDFAELGHFLADKIKTKTGLDLPVNTDGVSNIETVIYINQTDLIEFDNPEAYELRITSDSVILSSNSVEGAFRGLQTLRQIIPETSNDTLAETKIWVIPTGKITDEPQFEYRSSMLDVSRHFFSVQTIKKYIDILAYYKYNALHLHLTDDQGWRIEIKSWPKLTEIGGNTEVGGKSGGFYTQEEYTEIVNYAATHHIMIIPEIDLPGHTNAASVSYPFLNGNGKTPRPYTGMEVGFSTVDTRKDTVYAFIDDVIRELAALTPDSYIHIGGDESHSTKKEDYIYFINKVEKIVRKYDKIMIGWDEIATADLDSNSIAQFWANLDNAQTAANKGMKVILSPAKKAYLDMKYDSTSTFGLNWAAFIPVDTGYNWSPESYAKIPKDKIFGIEAPLWSETISNVEELEYLAFPRVIGYAELGWTVEENRDWTNYKLRLANQTPYLNQMNVKYYPSSLIDWKENTSKVEKVEK